MPVFFPKSKQRMENKEDKSKKIPMKSKPSVATPTIVKDKVRECSVFRHGIGRIQK